MASAQTSPIATQTAGDSLGSAVAYVWGTMSASRRRQFWLVMSVMLLGAVAELFTIGAVLPFLALIADPARAHNIPGVGWFLDQSFVRATDNVALFAGVLLMVAGTLAAIVRLLLTRATLRFVSELGQELGARVFGRTLRQPYSYYVQRNSSELLSSLEKVQAVIWSVLVPMMQGMTAAIISGAIIVFLCLINSVAAISAAVAMLGCYLAVTIAVRRRLKRNSERYAIAATDRIQIIQEGLGGIRDLLLEQSQEVFESKFRRIDREYRGTQTANYFIAQAPRYVIEAAGITLMVTMALLLTGEANATASAIPVLGALALGAQRMLPLLQQSYVGWSSFQGNAQMLIDVVGLMRGPVVTSVPRDRSMPVVEFRSEIRLDKVGFQYSDRQLALRDIDLTIAKGSRIGFVGETGSGKSTLLDLVMGLLEPSRGTITVDGVALSDSNRANWQAQIAHVPQTIYLSDSSMASNIAFAKAEEQIDFDAVRRAAELAHIHSFIEQLPDGYATLVGERGIRLSGGQRQRLGIARALYRRAPVLVLDEATSALDDATEKAIMKSIGTLAKDITMLMIAHRSSTLADCDLIVRLDRGQIVEMGTYAQLLGRARVA